jgi:hypothetical protein
MWSYENPVFYTPVFLEEEIKSQPLKWLKYLLLEKVSATTMKELDSTIKRFARTNIQKAKDECQSYFSKTADGRMIVVKLVYFDKAGQLPNFRIFSINDVDAIFEQILLTPFRGEQIWLCHSDVNQEGSNLGGRIILPNSNFSPIIAEIVWFTSPRRIEEYSGGGFKFPYLRAIKYPGSMHFTIEELLIPKIYPQNKEKYQIDFQFVLSSLMNYRDTIGELENILFGAGANELSLEFKISTGKFSIIDWDTEIETSIS